ncbi:MAG: response regulator transcription factor [bacterium]
MSALKVLVVDDHAGFRKSLAKFLQSQRNVEVVGEAVDGANAIAQTERLKPDLVILDLEMPDRDGFETAQVIKRQYPGTYLVLLSMHGNDIYRLKARQCMVDGFIHKTHLKEGLLMILRNRENNMVSTAQYASVA